MKLKRCRVNSLYWNPEGYPPGTGVRIQVEGVDDSHATRDKIEREIVNACNEHADMNGQLATIRSRLEAIVCTGGCDAGVVLMSQEGTAHTEIVDGRPMQVYDHPYFSQLGDALIDLYKLAGGVVEE